MHAESLDFNPHFSQLGRAASKVRRFATLLAFARIVARRDEFAGGMAGGDLVAQSCTLLYRRIVFGRTLDGTKASGVRKAAD